MTKLKPCPFCGGEAKTYHANGYGVGCDNGWCSVRVETFAFPTKKEAIEAWNARADDAYSDDGK